MKSEKTIKGEVSIVLAGAAGQGIQSIEKILSHIIKEEGYHGISTSEFMSRVRGGMNSTEIRVSSHGGHAYVDNIDIFIPLKKGLTPFLEQRINDETVIIGEKEELDYEQIIDVPFSAIAKEIGNKIYSNSVALGLIGGLLSLSETLMNEHIVKVFSAKGEEIVENNRRALQEGYRRGKELGSTYKIEISKNNHSSEAPMQGQTMLLSGTDAVALGALAGGCNMISSYPMSPSTGVLVSLAGYAERMGIVAEQAESEIAAINMALGGWYAGGRAMITTSGGGYDLMTEGTSLAAMIESPMVFHIAQRPGPATGLPTRTGQEDLNLVLYAGHGEYPRVVLAPGTTTEAFELTRQAFDIADRFQVPVFILTDQYLVDSFFDTPRFEIDETQPVNHIVKTDADYRRYQLRGKDTEGVSSDESGLSPRGIPGYGEGRVRVDSDEHTEEGFITEDVLGVRPPMVEKRLFKKLRLLEENALPPKLIGSTGYSTLVICWGSNRNAAAEALQKIGSDKIALLHLPQLFPLHPSVAEYLERAEGTCVVENNATGQCADLLEHETGQKIDEKVLKYNGIPFSVEELQEKIEKIAGVHNE